MREILFRGKSIETVDDGEWVYGYYNMHRGGFDDEYHEYIQEKCGVNHMVDPDTVGQFTGLLDKNGNKIFEGDIVCFATAFNRRASPLLIEFSNFELVAKAHNYLHRLEHDDKIEVIGNKWSNPELFVP